MKYLCSIGGAFNKADIHNLLYCLLMNAVKLSDLLLDSIKKRTLGYLAKSSKVMRHPGLEPGTT